MAKSDTVESLRAKLKARKAQVRQRELQLLTLVGSYAHRIGEKYPATRPHFEDLEAQIIALTVDWE
jgi:hypothetical protein